MAYGFIALVAAAGLVYQNRPRHLLGARPMILVLESKDVLLGDCIKIIDLKKQVILENLALGLSVSG